MKQHNKSNRRVLLIFIICALSACLYSCAERPTTREIRDIPSISEIEVSSGVDVFVTFGQGPLLEVETSRGSLGKLKTEVTGSKLKIFYKGNLGWSKKAKVFLQVPKIEKITTSGGSDLIGENTLIGEILKLRASGGSDIRLEVEVNSIRVKTSGGADIVLSGNANYIEAETSGGSDLKASQLTVQSANLKASGGSDITIHVTEALQARTSGGADIRYKGNPTQIDTENSAGGEVKKID